MQRLREKGAWSQAKECWGLSEAEGSSGRFILTSLEGNMFCQQLDFRLATCGTLREQVCIVLGHPFVLLCYGTPGKLLQAIVRVFTYPSVVLFSHHSQSFSLLLNNYPSKYFNRYRVITFLGRESCYESFTRLGRDATAKLSKQRVVCV